MQDTIERHEELLDGLKHEFKSIYKYCDDQIRRKNATSMRAVVDSISEPEDPESLMSYLISQERYEDAWYVKELCDLVKEKLENGNICSQ